MNDSSIVEAYEWARFAETLSSRLEGAQSVLAELPAQRPEAQWLSSAEALVRGAVAPVLPSLPRARLLPELSFLREEVAEEYLNHWVDGLEKLLAGITFQAGSRAPVIEALFPPKTKLPNLRRASLEAAKAFAQELDRRTKGSYVTRIFAQEDMQFVQPVLESVRQAFADYLAVFEGSALGEDEMQSLKTALAGVATELERVCEQAKLLAEAALLPFPGAFEEVGLNLKPKRRAKVAAADPEIPAEEPQSPEEPSDAPESAPVTGPEAAPASGGRRKAKAAGDDGEGPPKSKKKSVAESEAQAQVSEGGAESAPRRKSSKTPQAQA